MNMRLAISAAYYALIKIGKEHKTLSVEGEKVSVKDCKFAVYSLMHHVYPKMESERFKKVVRCADCDHYRTQYKKKNPNIKRHICIIDKIERPPDFYCANGFEGGKIGG